MDSINSSLKKIPNILILGANGQVGYSLVIALHSFANIIPITRNEVDISNLYELSNFLNNLTIVPDMIINASAYTAVDKAEQDKVLCNLINYNAVELIALYCKDKNITLIHYSTDYVFDGTKEKYTENDEPNPINTYGKTKLLGEESIQIINPFHIIFRTSWVYDSRGSNFLLTMLKLSQSKNELKVVKDQFGSPTWSYTIANITSYIIINYILKNNTNVNNYSGIYNLVSSGYTNWADYAKKIFLYAKKDIKIIGIPSSEYPTPAKRPKYSILSTEKIQNTFNIIVPKWDDALQYCMHSIINN